MTGEFLRAVVAQAARCRCLSGEHFAVEATLVEAWASLKRSNGEMASSNGQAIPRRSALPRPWRRTWVAAVPSFLKLAYRATAGS